MTKLPILELMYFNSGFFTQKPEADEKGTDHRVV